MKKLQPSTQTILLGILLGMSAWVFDALISWVLFPGSSFFELLIFQDPDRTLYMRAVVVILFFAFGLLAGRFMHRLEVIQERRERDVQLLEGVRRVHEAIGHIQDGEELLASLTDIFTESLGCRHIRFVLAGENVPDPDRMAMELQVTMDAQTVGFLNELVSDVSREHSEQEKEGLDVPRVIGQIRFQGKFYAYYVAEPEGEWAQRLWDEPFLRSLFSDIGLALAQLEDKKLLARSEERLQELYDKAPIGLFTSSFSGRLLFVNRHLAWMLGDCEPAVLLRKRPSVTSFYQKQDQREQFLNLLREDGWVKDFQTTFVTTKGVKLQIRIAARLTEWEQEGDPVIEGFVLDETEQLASQAYAKALSERLQEVRHFMAVAGLASGVAHEFNNILQSMMGSAYLAQQCMEPDSKGITYLKDIEEAGLRAAKLSDKMLSYSGKKAVSIKVTNSSELVRKVKPELKRVSEKNEVPLKITSNHDPVSVRIDPASFPEIVMHLVQNALEALPESGKREVRIETDVRVPDSAWCKDYRVSAPEDPGSYWILKVSDSGEGISSEKRQHIFDPFYTTRFQGRGLGLSAVKGMVDRFEGLLGMKSEPGNTEFVVGLPVTSSVEFEAEVEEPSA